MSVAVQMPADIPNSQHVVTESWSADIKYPPTSVSHHWSADSRQSSTEQTELCVVCDEAAQGQFFGAVVCLPCKSFYIRCTKEPCILQQCGGNCDIKKQLRNRCQFCRYQQCLAVGMARKEKPESVQPIEGQELCKVCGDLAYGIHFGVSTCEGCKKFFRRGLRNHQHYICKGVKQCLLNPRNRNNCRYCRYVKCMSVGMSRLAIKMGRPRKLYPHRDMVSNMDTMNTSKAQIFYPGKGEDLYSDDNRKQHIPRDVYSGSDVITQHTQSDVRQVITVFTTLPSGQGATCPPSVNFSQEYLDYIDQGKMGIHNNNLVNRNASINPAIFQSRPQTINMEHDSVSQIPPTSSPSICEVARPPRHNLVSACPNVHYHEAGSHPIPDTRYHENTNIPTPSSVDRRCDGYISHRSLVQRRHSPVTEIHNSPIGEKACVNGQTQNDTFKDIQYCSNIKEEPDQFPSDHSSTVTIFQESLQTVKWNMSPNNVNLRTKLHHENVDQNNPKSSTKSFDQHHSPVFSNTGANLRPSLLERKRVFYTADVAIDNAGLRSDPKSGKFEALDLSLISKSEDGFSNNHMKSPPPIGSQNYAQNCKIISAHHANNSEISNVKTINKQNSNAHPQSQSRLVSYLVSDGSGKMPCSCVSYNNTDNLCVHKRKGNISYVPTTSADNIHLHTDTRISPSINQTSIPLHSQCPTTELHKSQYDENIFNKKTIECKWCNLNKNVKPTNGISSLESECNGFGGHFKRHYDNNIVSASSKYTNCSGHGYQFNNKNSLFLDRVPLVSEQYLSEHIIPTQSANILYTPGSGSASKCQISNLNHPPPLFNTKYELQVNGYKTETEKIFRTSPLDQRRHNEERNPTTANQQPLPSQHNYLPARQIQDTQRHFDSTPQPFVGLQRPTDTAHRCDHSPHRSTDPALRSFESLHHSTNPAHLSPHDDLSGTPHSLICRSPTYYPANQTQPSLVSDKSQGTNGIVGPHLTNCTTSPQDMITNHRSEQAVYTNKSQQFLDSHQSQNTINNNMYRIDSKTFGRPTNMSQTDINKSTFTIATCMSQFDTNMLQKNIDTNRSDYTNKYQPINDTKRPLIHPNKSPEVSDANERKKEDDQNQLKIASHIDPYVNEQTLVYINEMFMMADTLTDSLAGHHSTTDKCSIELDALDTMFTKVYRYSPLKVNQFWGYLYSYMPCTATKQWRSLLTIEQLTWRDVITVNYAAQVEACDEEINPPAVDTNESDTWPPRGQDARHWQHLQERVARQTYAQAQFVHKLPGISKLHLEGRQQFGSNTRLFGNSILMASREWFDPVRKKFKFFWNWKMPQEHFLSSFKNRIIKAGSQIFNLHMDQTEVALLSALNLINPGKSTFHDLSQVSEQTEILIRLLCYHLTTINVDPDERVPELLSVLPKVWHFSVWYSNLIKNMDNMLQDLSQLAARRASTNSECPLIRTLPDPKCLPSMSLADSGLCTSDSKQMAAA